MATDIAPDIASARKAIAEGEAHMKKGEYHLAARALGFAMAVLRGAQGRLDKGAEHAKAQKGR